MFGFDRKILFNFVEFATEKRVGKETAEMDFKTERKTGISRLRNLNESMKSLS